MMYLSEKNDENLELSQHTSKQSISTVLWCIEKNQIMRKCEFNWRFAAAATKRYTKSFQNTSLSEHNMLQ